jgi:DNA polymerase-3 subunit delta
MFFLLYGEDIYRSRRKLRLVREQFATKRDATGLNTAVFREGVGDLGAVLEGLYASPFLAEKKLIVLDGFLRAATAEQQRLAEALGRKPASTIVVFYEDCGAKELEKSVLYPLLLQQQFTEDFALPVGRDLAKHIQDECRSYDCMIEPKAVEYLVAAVGGDTWQLHEEIHKVCAFSRGRGQPVVTAETVKNFVPARHDDSIFALVDACSGRNAGAAVLLIERLVAEGVAELQIVSMLLKQFKNLIACRELVDRGETDKFQVAKALGIHHFPAGKAILMCRKWRPEALRDSYQRILEIDRRLKTGYAKPKLLLQLFAASSQS